MNKSAQSNEEISELQQTVEYLQSALVKHRIKVFWFCALFLLILFLFCVKELTTLLLASYGIALLLDPIVSFFEKKRISRAISIVTIGVVIFGGSFLIFLLAVPVLISQYQGLILHFPEYLNSAVIRINEVMSSISESSYRLDADYLIKLARDHISALGVEQLKSVASAALSTMLQGYSLVLTFINLCLLPFFVFYITRDIRIIHKFFAGFMSKKIRLQVMQTSEEILSHIYAFFKGQITVCIILAALYVICFSIIGLPRAFIVGAITGLGNLVPYLGVALGLLLATILSLVQDASISNLLIVYLVFIALNFLEGSFLTPRIVGKSIGIHPLAVMLALIVGGQLGGLIGLVLAIPSAAAVRVLLQRIFKAVERVE